MPMHSPQFCVCDFVKRDHKQYRAGEPDKLQGDIVKRIAEPATSRNSTWIRFLYLMNSAGMCQGRRKHYLIQIELPPGRPSFLEPPSCFKAPFFSSRSIVRPVRGRESEPLVPE